MEDVMYRDFIIRIVRHTTVDKKGRIQFDRYTATVTSENDVFPFKWIKDYDRNTNKLENIIEEAKFNIDEYLKDMDKYKITITLRTPVKNTKKLVRFLIDDVAKTLSDYDVVKLERIEAFNKDKALVDGMLFKNEKK